MKNCERCWFLSSGFHGEGICEMFGDDLPDWADNGNDGCLLRNQEVDKALKLRQDILYFDFENREADGTPIWSENDHIRYDAACKKYDDYIKELKKRCDKRRSK